MSLARSASLYLLLSGRCCTAKIVAHPVVGPTRAGRSKRRHFLLLPLFSSAQGRCKKHAGIITEKKIAPLQCFTSPAYFFT